MSGLQWVIGWVSTLQTFGLFAILIAKGHYRRLPVFTIYVGGNALSAALVGLAYGWNVHVWEAWTISQVSTAALRLGMALELSYAIFGAFPAAAATARRVMFALLVLTALAAMSVSGPEITYKQLTAEMVPRLATGAVWILTALAALVLWYRLPLRDLQKAILLGYAPYLIVFTVAMNLLSSVGWHLRSWVGYIDTLSFFVLIHYWCRVAWRTAPDTAAAVVQPAAQHPRLAS
jgi:hypothetical protein